MGKFVKPLVVLALVAYLIFLVVARTPATWGAWAVHKALPNVWLTGVSGTIWDGRAGNGAAMVGDQALPLENLRWQIQPWSLLSMRICANVNAEILSQPASGVFCGAPGDRLVARNVQLSGPMAVAAEALNIPLSGLTSLQLQTLRVKSQRIEELEGNLSWRDARWHNGESWVALGAFAAKLSPNEQGGVQAQIFDLDGPFTVDLVANLVLNQEPRVQGTVAAAPEAPEQIRSALEFVGVPQDDGSFRIAWPPGT
jgi:general secretion pathway protein N